MAKKPHKRRMGKMVQRQKNCPYCGCVLTKANRSVDHVVPKVLIPIGKHAKGNTRLCCKACNSRKGEQVVIPDYREKALA